MDWDRVEGDWKQMKGKVNEKWGKLTDDDLTAIKGRRDQLEGKIQERYGYAKNQARKEIEGWYRSTEHHLADEIETIRTEIQSLTSVRFVPFLLEKRSAFARLVLALSGPSCTLGLGSEAWR
jgi:uncharacterized protein YjbJ (UPF0337 family)